MSLFERFRPATFADVVGQDKAVARLQSLAQRGIAGRAYWFAGLSGTGKTTLARIVAGLVAVDVVRAVSGPLQVEQAGHAPGGREREVTGAFTSGGWGMKRQTYGYEARRWHHVVFKCRNNGIQTPFWLTVQEMRDWHREA